MSPGKRKAARRLLDSWINDIYVRADSCLQQSRPPCSAGEKRAGPGGRSESAPGRRWLQRAGGRDSREPTGNNRPGRAAGSELRPRGNSAGSIKPPCRSAAGRRWDVAGRTGCRASGHLHGLSRFPGAGGMVQSGVPPSR